MSTPAEQALELKNKGNEAIAKKDWAVFTISSEPTFIYIYIYIYEIDTDTGGLQAAVDWYTEAIELDPTALYYSNRAHVRLFLFIISNH